MKALHQSIEDRVAMFRSFYRKENERPLLGFFLGSEFPVTRYPSMSRLPEHRPLKPEDFPVEEFLADSESLFQTHELCGGDFIWSGSAYWGIPWLEAALGCTIYVNHATGSIYSEPPVFSNGKISARRFDPGDLWVGLMETMLKGLEEKSAGRWPIGTTRMRGISDLLSALYGGTELVVAMMEEPDSVHSVCDDITDLWLKMARFQIDRIPAFHDGIGSFYYNAWAPRQTVWSQEDATALLSPGLFSEFIETRLRKVVDAVPGCIMHQHSTGFTPTESYLNMGFVALELHIDEGGPPAEELFDRHQSILATKPLIIWGDIPERDMKWLFSKLPNQGLAVITVVENPEHAKSIWEKFGS
jgi:hypothetical protein